MVLPATLSTSSGSARPSLEMDADRTDVGRRSIDDRALDIRIVGDRVGRHAGDARGSAASELAAA